MKTKIYLAGLGILLILILVGANCKTYPPQPPTNQPTVPPAQYETNLPTKEANDVALNFYSNYIMCFENMAAGVVMEENCLEQYRTNNTLTQNLQSEIKTKIDAMTGPGAYDPLICAQNFPSNAIVGEPKISGEQALLNVSLYFGELDETGNNIDLTMIVEGSEWKIDEIKCPIP